MGLVPSVLFGARLEGPLGCWDKGAKERTSNTKHKMPWEEQKLI